MPSTPCHCGELCGWMLMPAGTKSRGGHRACRTSLRPDRVEVGLKLPPLFAVSQIARTCGLFCRSPIFPVA
eukprot:6475408-Amphidinium_carterae.1